MKYLLSMTMILLSLQSFAGGTGDTGSSGRGDGSVQGETSANEQVAPSIDTPAVLKESDQNGSVTITAGPMNSESKNTCSKQLIEQKLASTQYADLTVTNVERSFHWFSKNSRFVFDATDSSGNHFEGEIYMTFRQQFVGTIDQRTGSLVTPENESYQTICEIAHGRGYASKLAFQLKNHHGTIIYNEYDAESTCHPFSAGGRMSHHSGCWVQTTP